MDEGGDANAGKALLPSGDFRGGLGVVRTALQETSGDGSVSHYSHLLAQDRVLKNI